MIFLLSTSSTYCCTNVVALPGIWHHQQGFSASSPFPRSTFSSSLPRCTKAARLSEPCSSLCPAWCGDNLRWVFSELTKCSAQWNQITSSSTAVNSRCLWRQNKRKHHNIRIFVSITPVPALLGRHATRLTRRSMNFWRGPQPGANKSICFICLQSRGSVRCSLFIKFPK